MQKKIYLIVVLLFITMTANIPAAASFQVDLTSRYIWRGFDLLDPNKPAVQPSVNFDFGESGFSLNIWSSFALAKWSEYRDANEIDITLCYSFSWRKTEFSVGVIDYGYYFAKNYSCKDNNTYEIFLTAGWPEFFLSPEISIFYDFNLGDGWYFQLKASRDLQLDKQTPNIWVGIGYNAHQYIEESGFSDLSAGISLPIPAGKLTISPFLSGALVFMDSVNKNDEIWGGVSLTF